MRKLFLLLSLFVWCYSTQAQTSVPIADLLDVKFSSQGKAQDISEKQFNVQPGSNVPTTRFDGEIKQYVSYFPQNTSLNRYFKVNYNTDSDFKNKLQKAFTFEVYVKTTGSGEMVSVGSMQNGGFGVTQTATGTTEFRLGKSSTGYNSIGSENNYNEIKQEYYHMVFTYDGNTIKAYHNGVYKSTVSNAGSLRFSSDKNSHWIAIGGDVNGASLEKSFRGEVAAVRMYSKALSDNEVSSLYKQIQDRKTLSNADLLNKLLTISLPQYADQTQAKQYINEGWGLMQSLSTTEQDINNFKEKIVANLGISAPETSDYPRFAVLSDLHLGSTGYVDPEGKATKAIKILKGQNPKLDAIFVVGDVVNNGTTTQLNNAVKLFSEITTITPVYYSMGNHEWWEGNKDIFKSVIGQRLNQFIDIKGYPFIMISMDKREPDTYGSTAKAYLTSALERANREYPGKPIFLYMHVPMENTVYGSYPIPPGKSSRFENSTKEGIPQIISKYPQVVLFSGHSHMPVADERCIYQEKFTSIHNGAGVNVRSEDGTVEDTWPTDNGKASAGCIVSVDKNSDITVKRFDILRNEDIKQPWVIKAPHDGSQFVYTKDRTGGERPYFKPTDKITVGNINGGNCKITFPQAKDDDLVHHYIIKAYNKSGNQILNVTIFSRFYLGSQMPESLSWDVSGVNADCTFEIKAVDSFGNESDPLRNTPKDVKIQTIYLTGSAMPCGWTNTSPIEMKSDNDSIFSWEGTLKAAGEFKFLLQKGVWNQSVNPLKTQSVGSGVYSVKNTDGITGDYKFTTNRATYCSIKIDVKNWIVTITEDNSIKTIYLTGSATPCGWTNTSPIEMKSDNDSIFTWEGTLKTAGEFKFLLQKGVWNQSVNPLKTQSVSSGVYSVKKTDGITGDYKFTTSRETYCSITINVKNWTVTIVEDNSIKAIYLTGSAMPCGWSNTNPVEMTLTENKGIFSWEGTLKAAGEFKFLLKKGVWNQSVNPLKTQSVSPGVYSVKNTNGITGDYKFTTSKEAYYSIIIDTKNWAVTLAEMNVLKSATGTPEINSEKESLTIISKDGRIEVTCNQGTMSRAKLLSMTGVSLDAVTKEDKMYYLGNNLPKGVYIVEIVADGQRSVSKVAVK